MTDGSAEGLSTPKLTTDEARRQHLFDTYIARMFKRKGERWPYDTDQTKARLAWLARNMQRHNQEVFLIEGLQPSWLQVRHWRVVYILASRLLGGLIVGLVFWLIEELIQGLIFGLIVGLSVSFIDILRFEWWNKRQDQTVASPFWWPVINIAIFGLSGGLVFGLIGKLRVGMFGGLSGGLSVGLIFGLRGSRQSLINDIQTVEALRWSWGWGKALKAGLVGLIFWLIGWLIFWLIIGLIYGLTIGPIGRLIDGLTIGLIIGLITGLIYGPIFGLIGVVLSSLSREIIETKTVPNQGIRLSARNAIFGGLFVGLIVGLIGGLIGGLNDGLIVGLFFGLLGALWYGGLDIIQHYTLRLILIIQGHTPRNYARFLDYAADLIFLQKVGGGYRFIHRLLLEHFAEMESKQ